MRSTRLGDLGAVARVGKVGLSRRRRGSAGHGHGGTHGPGRDSFTVQVARTRLISSAGTVTISLAPIVSLIRSFVAVRRSRWLPLPAPALPAVRQWVRHRPAGRTSPPSGRGSRCSSHVIFACVAVLGATGAYLGAITLLNWYKSPQTYTTPFTLWMFLAHVGIGVAAIRPVPRLRRVPLSDRPHAAEPRRRPARPAAVHRRASSSA